MIKLLLFLVLAFLGFQATAQNHFIGIKGGPAWVNIAPLGDKAKNTARSVIAEEITYEYLLDKHFSLGAGFSFNQQGFGYRDITSFQIPDISEYNYKSDYRFDYFSVPIKAGFNVGNSWYSFVNLGLSPSFLNKAEVQTKRFNLNGIFIGSETENRLDQMQKFDLFGLFEIGGGYKVKQRFWLFAAFTYQVGLLDNYLTISNTESDYYSFREMNLALGLKYALTSYSKKEPAVSPILNEYALKTSKRQKTSAQTLLYSGLGIAALGGIIQLGHANNQSNSFDIDFTGTWIAIGGGCVSLVSVPLFISSGINKRKATTISLIEQPIFIQQIPTASIKVPSASLKIKF
jgi:hypothetical protein